MMLIAKLLGTLSACGCALLANLRAANVSVGRFWEYFIGLFYGWSQRKGRLRERCPFRHVTCVYDHPSCVCVRACVRACVCMRVRVRASERACVCLYLCVRACMFLCQGLMSAIDELHARKDNKHRVRMLSSLLRNLALALIITALTKPC